VKIDLHVHSQFSYDSATRPEIILQWARRRGLAGVCITEHHSFENSAPFEHHAPHSDILIFRGAEAATSLGHFLLFGVKDDSWNSFHMGDYIDTQALINLVNVQGGAVVAAHPFRTYDDHLGNAEEHFGGWKIAELQGLAAVEVWNACCTDEQNEQAVQLARYLGLPGTGGSDAHVGAGVGQAYTIFEQPIGSIIDLVRMLKQGRCRPGNGEMD